MNNLLSRVLIACAVLVAGLGTANAQSTPSSSQIYKKLAAPSSATRRTGKAVGLRELKRNRKLRRSLPTVQINSINFAFGSDSIPPSQRWKVRNIADALLRFRGRGGERFLIEGHTDAVGSFANNQNLSERRAASLRRALVQWFGVPRRMLVTVGYGEEFLLVPTQRAEWRNRRVTLRRATGVLR